MREYWRRPAVGEDDSVLEEEAVMRCKEGVWQGEPKREVRETAYHNAVGSVDRRRMGFVQSHDRISSILEQKLSILSKNINLTAEASES